MRVTNLEELVDLAEVDSLLGIQFVNITDVAIHQIQTKPHHLGGPDHRREKSYRPEMAQRGCPCIWHEKMPLLAPLSQLPPSRKVNGAIAFFVKTRFFG